MVFRLFFFENNRLNLAVYFAVTTLILLLGPERFVPGLKQSRKAPLVEAPCGSMTGLLLMTRRGRYLDAYRGIPFARPPLGARRFARPEPFEDPAWDDVREAEAIGSQCVQPHSYNPLKRPSGSEDCLYLSVFRPSDTPKGKKTLPVMVWFHGGGFVNGAGDSHIFGPGYLLDRDVILVGANYRLGVMGFLSMGKDGEDDDIQGNQGMWDQVEALKWVRKNIRSFGGDPKRVTIFGVSAGGMSVSAHLLSRASRGLFQAAIVQSGPIYAPFVSADRNKPLHELHKTFSQEVGCIGDVDVVAKCLREKPVGELFSKLFIFDECNMHEPDTMPYPASWVYTDDSEFSSNPFFGQDPIKTMQEDGAAKVPIIIGFTKEDGLLPSATFKKHPQLFDYFKLNFETCGSGKLLGKFFGQSVPNQAECIAEIRKFYLGDVDLNLDLDFNNITTMFTDAEFAAGSDLMVKDLMAKGRNNIYYYSFDHEGSFSIGDIFSSNLLTTLGIVIGNNFGFEWTKKLGASHGDDLLYLFRSELPLKFLNEDKDAKMIDLMVDLWANFATFHNPTPPLNMKAYQNTQLVNDATRDQVWPAIKPKDPVPYPSRLKNGFVINEKETSFLKRMEFWHKHVSKRIFKIA